MKQKYFLLLLAFVCTTLWAEPIDEEQARAIAVKFIKKHNPDAQIEKEAPAFAPSRKRISEERVAEMPPTYYVFNTEDENGFVIVSADDRTDAVLGYSTSGHFDADKMPDHLKAWMQGYAEQISLLSSSRPQSTREYPAAISPLLTTLWNQDSPYNNQCPLLGSSRTYTGCTATALAQVMKYHEWPAEQTTSIPAYTSRTAQIYVPELAPTVFQWDEMNDDYHYSDYAPAVAKLMRYCGQALESDFTSSSTSAYLNDIPLVLTQYFDYDTNIDFLYQANHPISEWEEIIYAELQASRPVLHAGTSLGGGHAFVCDGYDGNGLFHFNWGWGGMYDGYYKLALLTPGTDGIGAGTEDGFSANQRIVVGIQPPTQTTPTLKPFGAVDLQQSGTNLFCNFQNPNTTFVSATVGFALVDNQGQILRILKDCGSMTLKGYNLEKNWAGLYMGPGGEVELSPGTHHIAAVCKMSEEGEWQRAGNKQTYFEVEVAEGNELVQVVLHPITKMEITSFECISSEVVGTRLKVRITVENQGDDMNSMLYFYVSETDRMNAPLTRIPLLLRGNETTCYEVSFFAQNTGTYYMWISDVDDRVNYLAKRVLNVIEAPTNPSDLTLTSCKIDAEHKTAEIEVYNNSNEPYYRPMVAYLFEELYGDGNYYYVKKSEQSTAIPPHESKVFNFSFEEITTKNPCYIYIGYYYNHTDEFTTQLGETHYFHPQTTSVRQLPLKVDPNGTTIYRLDGTHSTNLNQKGIYIVNGQKRIVK